MKSFQLPPYTRIMLADVDAGSDTPSLVGKVLKWRSASGEAGKSSNSPVFSLFCVVLICVVRFSERVLGQTLAVEHGAKRDLLPFDGHS